MEDKLDKDLNKKLPLAKYLTNKEVTNYAINGVFRGSASGFSGYKIDTDIPEKRIEKQISYTLPASIINTKNIRIVAFVINDKGHAINAQQAYLGEDKKLEEYKK